ncbi:MAG TPA: S-layer homology domain-containing protein [Anaerovoracaceae bacterium]|nr:S-layer homology domain-containing protein [Anaerovoracaceae bacterium]
MAFNRSRKITAGLLTTAMLAGTFLTGFTYQDGIGNVYYETKSEIFDGATYSEQLAGHNVNGIERAYFVTADTGNTELKPYVFEGEVTGTYTVGTMVDTLENQGYKVVAGINGDLYDTATGTPKGLTIHGGKIKTSGYAPEFVISFDEDGKASLEKVNLGYTLKGTINVSTQVVVPPPVQEQPTAPDANNNQQTDPYAGYSIDPTTGNPIDPATGYPIDRATGRLIDPFTGQLLDQQPVSPGNAQPQNPATQSVQQSTTVTEYVPTEYTAPIGFFNVPHGESKALHLYNRQYAPTTKVWENSVEVILDAGSVEDAEPTVGGTIEATVVEVRNGTTNTPIGDGQLVLSAAGDSAYAVPISQLVPGSTVEISVENWEGQNSNLNESKEAIGVYYVMCDKGQVISNGTNVNPRTALGIKEDGSVMLYVLDGRQPGFSAGLGLTDMMKHMLELGATTVVNMDGGGSASMAVREAGLDAKPAVKNSPSDGTQRKVTNGLLLVYQDRGGSKAENLHTYASQPLAMPGAEIQLSSYASNDKYEPVSLQRSVEYSLDSDSDSTVDENGLFTAGSDVGTVEIEAKSGNLETQTQIDVQKDITFTTNVQNLIIDPGKTSDINVTARFGYAQIASKDSLFTFSCDPNVGTIDPEGLFQASMETGISGNIYVAYNGVTQTIPVQIGASLIDFKDTATHWARESIGRLAARGIVNGMGDNYYKPDDSLTRAQFLTMLAKTIYGLDPSQSAATGFADVPDYEWFYSYVNWGYANGIVNGLDEVTFAPNNNITREQMAIMLSNFARNTGLVLPETGAVPPAFTDSDMISPWAAEAVEKIVSSGIMGGYPEGNYSPQGKATRAEAATVIYKLILIRDNIAKANNS